MLLLGKNDFSSGVGYFLRIESLHDRQRLTSLIIDPCVALFNDDPDAARSELSDSALEAKEFFRD